MDYLQKTTSRFDSFNLLESIVVVCDENGDIVFANNAVKSILGFDTATIVGDQWWEKIEAVNGSDKEKRKILAAKMAKGQLPTDTSVLEVTPLKNKEGKVVWTQWSNTRTEDNFLIGIAQDITKNKEIEEQLKQSENNFKFINETINEVFYLYNIEKEKYDYISPSCQEIMGVSPNFFYTGKSYTKEYAHPEDKSLLYEAKSKVDNGESYEIEYRVIIDNTIKWIKEKSFPIKNDEGKIIKNSGICSDITVRKKTEEELKRTNENAKLLSEIGKQISSTHSIVKIIDQVYESVNQLMDATAFGVGIINKEKNRLDFPRLIEKGVSLENAGYELDDDSRLAILCVKNEKEIIINDFDNEFKQYTFIKAAPVAGESSQSILYLPLKLKEEIIGVVTVQSFEKYAYDEYQLNLLRNLSVYIANAIESANLYETMEEQIKLRTQEALNQKKQLEINYANTKLLSEIGQQMASSLSFEEIFMTLHENVNKVMNAEMFGVRIYHPQSNMIEYKYEMEGGKREEVVFVPMNDDDNYSVWCIKNKKEIFINDNKNEYKKYVKEIKVPMGQMPNSLLFYPMIVKDKVIGVITVQCMEKNAYNDYHLDVLKTLASYAGSALHNASLYETLEIKVKDRTVALEEKNKSIMDSINYAKRIQDVILPEKKIIDKFLKDYFIFYQPKDIISGDFYLIDEIITSNGERLHSMIIGDCTGHGVPGGMLSMLCSSLIRQSFKMKEINSPADSLKFVSNQLQSLFKGDATKRTLMDGMDAAYCVLNKEKKVLHFAGANNSILIIRDKKIIEIKGDKQSVSYTENFVPFNLHEIKIEDRDVVYLYTDGFPDQFGGENDKKYKKNQFKDFLLSIHNKPMNEQYKMVHQEFISWKGNNEQTDDICILGVRI